VRARCSESMGEGRGFGGVEYTRQGAQCVRTVTGCAWWRVLSSAWDGTAASSRRQSFRCPVCAPTRTLIQRRSVRCYIPSECVAFNGLLYLGVLAAVTDVARPLIMPVHGERRFQGETAVEGGHGCGRRGERAVDGTPCGPRDGARAKARGPASTYAIATGR